MLLQEPGTLNITFDNSYSRWTSKWIFLTRSVNANSKQDTYNNVHVVQAKS